MKILVVDNYDSFTYNLVHYVESLTDAAIEVYRNDEISVTEMQGFDKIMFSPGPGLPSQAGIMIESIKKYASQKSILGVCLGHQAIAEAFGGVLINLNSVYHGVATPMQVITEDKIFDNIPHQYNVGRYHSWVVNKNNLPNELEILALDEEQQIMALRHKQYDIRGVQFHPESILTEYGLQLIKNWIYN